MLDSTQSSDGVVTKPSSRSVAQTIDGLRRVIADRGFTVFNVIDHSGVAERVGVQMPDSKLVMFGKPTVGAAVMVAAPLAALDIPLLLASATATRSTSTCECSQPCQRPASTGAKAKSPDWPDSFWHATACYRKCGELDFDGEHYLWG
jgi:uncharacterized protein (DUF302 family)